MSLSEIDLADIRLLAERHGRYGVGFHRRWVQHHGGAPVWYLPRESPLQDRLFRIVKQLAYRKDPVLDHFLWEFTPFIDYPRDRDSPGSPYDWRWEREWRVRGDLRFTQDDVAVLFAPQTEHDAIYDLWRRRISEGTKLPPLVDTLWPLQRQIDALRGESLDPRTWAYNADQPPAPILKAGAALPPMPEPKEPPDDRAFDDIPESEFVQLPLEEEMEQDDPEGDAWAELVADEEFDLDLLLSFDDEMGSVSPEGADELLAGDEPDDDELAVMEQREEWASWLELADRDDV